MPKTHITAQGDTFDALALDYYNDEKLASTIIGANLDHCSTLIFEAGIFLTIPDVSTVTYPQTLPPWRREA
jgi:phage tail protein X